MSVGDLVTGLLGFALAYTGLVGVVIWSAKRGYWQATSRRTEILQRAGSGLVALGILLHLIFDAPRSMRTVLLVVGGTMIIASIFIRRLPQAKKV